MRALSAAELLVIWERGLTQTSVQRALLLLVAACPDTPPEQLAELSIGERDARLLTLREWMMGPQLVSLTTCPNCGDRLELNFAVSDIRVVSDNESMSELSLQMDDYLVKFRLPHSRDLAALPPQSDLSVARNQLLQQCILSTQYQGEAHSPNQLPTPVIDTILVQMAKADPQADVQLALSCPACSHQWQAVFDVVSFFWSEINAWAHRILLEVHTLASIYGWREADILAMSPQRRQIYLEMISG